jgi:hypothetical protein
MIKQDWIMNQIESLAMFIAKVFFKKDTTDYYVPVPDALTDTDRLHYELLELIGENRINDAEDLLFERMDTADMKYLEVAVDFYARLNDKTDEELEAAEFSREEIEEGLHDAAKLFGVNLIDIN